MPITIQEPEPCAEQRQLMESLGFEAQRSENENQVLWTLSSPLLPIQLNPLTVTLRSADKLNVSDLIHVIAVTHYQLGKTATQNAIKANLGLR